MNIEEIKREIVDISERWAKAIVSNDADAIGKFMSDDWIIVGENGSTGKEEFLSWISSGDVTHAAMQSVGETRIKIYGDTVVSTARVTNNGHYKNQPFSADEWTTDVFQKHANGWLCVLSHITPAKD
jgi:ketosteroid isomerase-like protein